MLPKPVNYKYLIRNKLTLMPKVAPEEMTVIMRKTKIQGCKVDKEYSATNNE
jgi:hypothetical protein